MAIVRIFPEKDTSIFTEGVYMNTGKDEMLELGCYKAPFGSNSDVIRSLLKFSSNDINTILQGKTSYSASLNLYVADASEIPVEFTIEAANIFEAWDSGVGHFADKPTNTTGASWFYRSKDKQNQWRLEDLPIGVTGSAILRLKDLEDLDFDSNGQGGNWYTGSLTSQSFELNSNLDISLNVTDIVQEQIDQSTNNGILLKLGDQQEQDQNLNMRLWYFSNDTNTIFTPHLNLMWDDSNYLPGDLPTISTGNVTITLSNNKGSFFENEEVTFRVFGRPTYPTRVFTTSSLYREVYALPEYTSWAIMEEASKEIVIDFDDNFTKLSCDSNGSYFNFHMQSLLPDRYYRIIFRVKTDDFVTVVDDENIFKVERYD